MKRFISYFFICCCSLLFSPNIAITQQDKLEIKLDISKNIFLKSEPILANIFVINRTNEMIYVKRLILVYDYFEILVTDATGKVFPCAYGRDMDPNVPHDTVSLGPNKSISQIIDLLPMYANGKRNLRNVHTRTYFEPGSYTVQAIYEINHTRFYSTIIPITILEPTELSLKHII
ncbi:MAG: hypothetical protein C0417_10480 [Chlorobiaceae bacterium]|nr:hypothetical protein [Chlorobiaceae bacterium]